MKETLKISKTESESDLRRNFKISLKNKKRTLSRLVCVQILYQYHFFEKKIKLDQIKEELIKNYVLFEDDKEKDYSNKIDEEFVDNLIFKIEENLSEIDEKISKLKIKNQEIEGLLLEILRSSCFELKNTETKKEIIIHEYVNITSLFFDDSKVSFVNSIIENLAKEYDKK